MREIALYREIAQRKHAEQQQQVLIAELHHRVKNTLAVVQGLVELSIRHTESLDAFRKSIAGRIASLAKSHTLLVEGQWLSVGLRTMIEGELEAHEGGERISIFGEGPHTGQGDEPADLGRSALEHLLAGVVDDFVIA